MCLAVVRSWVGPLWRDKVIKIIRHEGFSSRQVVQLSLEDRDLVVRVLLNIKMLMEDSRIQEEAMVAVMDRCLIIVGNQVVRELQGWEGLVQVCIALHNQHCLEQCSR